MRRAAAAAALCGGLVAALGLAEARAADPKVEAPGVPAADVLNVPGRRWR